MRSPSRKVPLVLPTSVIKTLSPRGSSLKWARETWGSTKTHPSQSRPRTIGCWMDKKIGALPGCLTTTTRCCIT